MNYFDKQPYVVAVIGAASGIGKATAQLLAGQGVTVACIDRDEAGAKATADAIVSKGGKASVAAADVVHPARLQAAISGIIEIAWPIGWARQLRRDHRQDQYQDA